MGHMKQETIKVKYRLPLDYDLFAEGTAEVTPEERNEFEVVAPDVLITSCHIGGAIIYPYDNPDFPTDLRRAIEAEAIRLSHIKK